MAEYDIVRLADAPRAVDILAAWFEAEWAPYYIDGPGDATADLTESCRATGLPMAFVARDTAGEVIGTAALKPESMASHAHLTPWLAAMLVAPDWRGQGVGTALARTIVTEARTQGFSEIFCAVDGSATLLPRLGWQSIDEGSTLRGQVAILRLAL